MDDDDESVKLGFGTLPTGITAGTVHETVVSITDNDDPQVNVSYGLAEYTAAEGGTVEVTVTLDVDPERTVTIPLTATNENGATDADYSGVPANVTFESGDTSKSFTFTATDDTVDDDDESVKLGFGTLPTGITAGTVHETVVSITDDDTPGDVSPNRSPRPRAARWRSPSPWTWTRSARSPSRSRPPTRAGPPAPTTAECPTRSPSSRGDLQGHHLRRHRRHGRRR